MGMLAVYMMIDKESLEPMMTMDNETLLDTLEEMEESDKFEIANIDKSWDILHYFLTGCSASTPIEENKLSEAIVGVHVFSYDEDADFIACTEHDELPEIISALENLDWGVCEARLNKESMKKANLYPARIEDESKEWLLREAKNGINALMALYKKALETNHHVIVSIL